MSYANKKERAKLKSMEKFAKKISYDKKGNYTDNKMEVSISFQGKIVRGVFFSDVIAEMLEYYNIED